MGDCSVLNQPKKQCRACRKWLPKTLDFFSSSRGCYLRSDCRQCASQRAAQWRRDNPHKAAETAREYIEKDPILYAFKKKKNNCKKNGIGWDVDIDYFRSLFPKDMICPKRRVKMVWAHKDDCPSVDQIVPKGGYVKGNMWIISNKANRMKNNAKRDELIQFALSFDEVTLKAA